MKKRFLILFSIFILFLAPNIIKAASANVSVSAPSSVYVGEKVKVSVTISSGVNMAGWEFNVAFDDSILSCDNNSISQSGASCGHVASAASSSEQKTVEYTWTLTAKKSGSASFSVSSIDVLDWDEGSVDITGSTSTSINVIKPSSGGNGGSGSTPSNNYKYSDNNNLSSLNIEGFDLNFDSSVTDYSVSVPNDTKKVKIGATASDGNASVSGIGDYDVKEGNNEIKIVVTAENGDTKTYKINVVVKELSPIEVKVNNKSYSVVRKSDKLPKVNTTYKASTILIKGESVPCYHSDITDIYLVGLTDDKGNVELFNYDSKNDKFNVYNEINVSGLYISLIDNKDVPIGYKSGLVKIGDKDYNGYLKDGAYSLLYGINLETGEKNFYSYDSSEGTLQKYTSKSGVDSKCYYYVIFGLIGLCVFEFIMIIASVVSKNKQLKKFLHNKLDVKTDFERKIDEDADANTSYKDEDNITDDLTDEYMSNDSESIDSENNVDESDSTVDDSLINSHNDISDNSYDDNISNNSYDSDNYDEDDLGHTALISRDLNNVFNNSVNKKDLKKRRKEKKKRNSSNDDEMFKF